MKKVPVKDAIGLVLCHDITKVVAGEFKGRAFQRNHVIQPEDVEELLKLGKEHIYVWEENKREIHEDEAAVRIAAAIKGSNISYEEPQEGKSILKANCKGLIKINSALLEEVNSIEDISIACLPNNFTVADGQKIAGSRIIPLVTEETKIDYLEKLCNKKGPALEVKPYNKLKVGIVTTGNEIYKGRIEDRFGPIINKKLAYFAAENLGQIFCPDESSKIEAAIDDFKEKKADVIILTGGMSVDPDDLTPGAIKKTGAEIVTYGVPVQPGNMFMMAYLKDTVLLGVPGAALYFKNTILDVVLPRVFAGEVLTKKDFIKMGEGGFCSNCRVCTYPNCYFCR